MSVIGFKGGEELDPVVSIQHLSKSFGSGKKEVHILDKINLEIRPHQLIALRGRSGSGKTTLLNLIGALDKPNDGEIYIEGKSITSLNEKERSHLRKEKFGFIFQSYGLVPFMTVQQNIEFGLRIAEIPKTEWETRIDEALELVRLTKRIKHFPDELSGGEQQRVAIARAIAIRPTLILADEPTSELDSKTGIHIIEVFQELVERKETTILLTSHDPLILEMIKDVYTLEDRKIIAPRNNIVVS